MNTRPHGVTNHEGNGAYGQMSLLVSYIIEGVILITPYRKKTVYQTHCIVWIELSRVWTVNE